MYDELKYRKRNLITFPMGTVGRDAIYCLVNSYLLTFILFTRSLTDGQLAAITAIMIAARVFDALNDPIMGNIIERTHSVYGKFKPWLVAGVLSTSVVVYLMFNVNLKGWAFVWFFGVMYFCFSITFTMNDISYWGMIPALSSDADARNQFTSRATLFAGIGSGLASVLIPVYTTGEKAIGGSTNIAYGKIALIICILAPLFLSITIFGAKERREEKPTHTARFSFKDVFQCIARNDQLVWAAVIFLVNQIGSGLIAGGIGGTYIYFTFGYNGGLYSIFTMVGLSASALLLIFYPTISKHVKRKDFLKKMAGLASIGYGSMLIAGLIPGASMVKFAIIVVAYMLINFGQNSFFLVMMISIMNTVEYNEYKFGIRDEAIITSLRPFISKLSSALVVALTSLSYILFGVTNYTNQISDLEQQCTEGAIQETTKLACISQLLTGVENAQTTGLLFFMTVIPCLLLVISYRLYAKKYKLDEEEYARICQVLEK